jgi:outer membrane usher protein
MLEDNRAYSNVQFDRGFFSADQLNRLDLDRFEQGVTVLPGVYRLDLFVNRLSVSRVDVRLVDYPGEQQAQACFDRSILLVAGLDFARLAPGAREQLEQQGNCLPLGQVSVQASARFDLGAQRLDLDIAQEALLRTAQGYVDPSLWDSGVDASFVDYSLNAFSFEAPGQARQTQGYVGLTTGLNRGDWHWRHQGALSSNAYQRQATYVQRDLGGWSSQLLIGQAHTSGELLDSLGFIGLRLGSDDRMLPASQRGFAPVVRGIADSNAKVTIRQNGVLLQEVLVAPGAFVIDDLYATGYGGDLQVSILEADGSQRQFSVPYSAAPMALREGAWRYSAVAGTLDDTRLAASPGFVQGTWQYGLSNLWTGYTGATVTEDYHAGLLGAALNSPFGAIGLDLTQARAQLASGRDAGGQRVRVSYAKSIPRSGTRVSLNAYGHSSAGYLGLSDALLEREQGAQERGLPRMGAALSLGQALENAGHLHLSASTTRYWQRDRGQVGFLFGYNHHYQRLGYGVSLNRERDQRGVADTRLQLTFSLPLGGDRGNLGGSFSRDSLGREQLQGSYQVGDERSSYGFNASTVRTPSQASQALNGYGSWRTDHGQWNAGLGTGRGSNQASLGLRGALVGHAGGLTFAQPLGETFGIVHVPDASGARLDNASGTRVDTRGYAVVSPLQPYSMNRVEIDPKGLPLDVELQLNSQQVAPRAGAVPLLHYPTLYGRAAVFAVRRLDGSTLPFGATLLSAEGQALGIVGQGGRIFARGLQDRGHLSVTWGAGMGQRCTFNYHIGETSDAEYPVIAATCET